MISAKKVNIEKALFSDTTQYNDILDYDYRGIRNRLQMEQHDRAGQFAPFSALTGFGSLLQQKTELYQRKRYPSKERSTKIMRQLNSIKRSTTMPLLLIHFFNGEVGYYEEIQDRITNVKVSQGRVYFQEHASIPIANIWEIKDL